MRRLLVIGCSGAGKSTLARQLAPRHGLPLGHFRVVQLTNDREVARFLRAPEAA
jgi:adenylate kinase family enzyme